MKVTFICAVFPPEPAPSGVMAHQLATRLARDGHDVTMVVPFPNRPDGVTFPGFRRRLLSRTVTNEGYTLLRCANWLIGKRRRNVNRILENVTFGLSSAWAAWREGRPDVIIIETWPLFASQLAASLASWWRVPYLYYVQDVYPEAAEVAGILNPGGSLARACRTWDHHLCLQSASVIVISETMLDLVAANRRLPRDRFTVIPNWIDESAFAAWQGEGTWRRSQNISDRAFVAMFAGTLGLVSGAKILVEVAQILQAEKNVLLLCIGEGVQKQAMLEASSRLGLNNIRFLPFQPGECVPEVQASSDVALLTMQPQHSDASVPSKLISYFAASRPVICAANEDSAVAQAVLDAAAGLVVCPGDAQAIAGAILRLMREPEMARQMGRNARRYFEQHYTLERAYRQFSALLMKRVLMNGGNGEHIQHNNIGRLAAFLVCVLGFPIHLLICICIRLADGGAPLYRDKRAGRFGQPFSMLKYRTMKVNCKPLIRSGCKVIVEANDPRVTPLGRLLRCGLDELVQLANVVRGEMGWIGPRPVPISMLSKYGPVIQERFRIQPGITGLAQVLDSRSCNSSRVFAIDIWYITHRNLLLDLWIIAATPLFICGWRSLGHNRLNRLLELPEFREIERRCQDELGTDVGSLTAAGVTRG